MNDPVTNVAIEDVLSSIRRLVSEDARVQPLVWRPDQTADDTADDGTDKAAAAVEAQPAGRLVLTPALRVTGADEAVEQAEADAPAAEDRLILDAPEPVEDFSPEAEVALSAAWEEELGQDAVAQAEAGDAPYVLGDAMTEQSAEAEAVGEAVTPAEAEAEALVWEDHHDAGPQGGDAQEYLDAAATEAVYVDAPHEAAPQEVTMPAMEEPAEPETARQDSGFVFASTRESGMRGDAVADTAADEADDMNDRDLFLRDDEAVLDEDMLRELVTEIVRQELQGALGERITRNVRKLVRREIHRALTSHEME